MGHGELRRAAASRSPTSSSRSRATRSRTSTTPLARGQNLILTPGVYNVDQSIEVKRADTVVLGMGHATLTAVGGAVPLQIADAAGIVVAGITIDAGTTLSPALLRVGKRTARLRQQAPTPPTRSPSATCTSASAARTSARPRRALEINADHVLIDHTWVWRADHGVEGFTGGRAPERWNTNTGTNGVIVNGDNVTATGLFVEHFQTVQHPLERRERPRDPVPERAAVRPADPGGLDAARRHPRLPRLHGRRRRQEPRPGGRRVVRLQPEQPVDRHRERVRGAGAPGREAAPPPDGEPRRGHDPTRRERHRGPVDTGAVGVPAYVVDYP